MDKIQKALQKLLPKELAVIKEVLLQLKTDDWSDLDIKKLKSSQNIFRVRKGKMRVIFTRNPDSSLKILTIERRSDNTYSQF